MFEDIHGAKVAVTRLQPAKLLPDASWEQSLASMPAAAQLPWAMLKVHTASETQRRLVKSIGLTPPSLVEFLDQDLLPHIYSLNSSDTEPLLLKAIDSLVSVDARLAKPLRVFVDNRLRYLSDKVVDSTDPLMKILFSSGQDLPYKLLPEQYATAGRIAVLKRHGLWRPSGFTSLFLACAKQFQQLFVDSDDRQAMLACSNMLYSMLKHNIRSYLFWPDDQIASLPFLVQATPHMTSASSISASSGSSSSSPMVSFQGSEDFAHYRTVVNAVPVTDPSYGDTTQLRAQLGCPQGPQLKHAVEHLLQTAKNHNEEQQPKLLPQPVKDVIKEDVEKAYAQILTAVSRYLTVQDVKALENLATSLFSAPWLLVQSSTKFVEPTMVVFEIEEDTTDGEQIL